MQAYKSYQEAKLANPEGEITTDGKGFYANREGVVDYGRGFCNPADYCDSAYDFLESGKRFVGGDVIIASSGQAFTVINAEAANDIMDVDKNRYVLKAAAYDIETPEEKEAFDMIDNTAKQVESLANNPEVAGGSERPEDDDCPYVQIRRLGDQLHNLLCELQDEPIADELSKTVTTLWSVETPEQKAEREFVENGEELYELFKACHADSSDFKWITLHPKTQKAFCKLAELVTLKGEHKE